MKYEVRVNGMVVGIQKYNAEEVKRLEKDKNIVLIRVK